MKLGMFAGLKGPQVSGAMLRDIGRGAEDIGLNSFWLGEHVVLFSRYESRYPGNPTGELGVPVDQGLMDLSTTIGFLAGVTTELRFGTGICLVPQRNPVYTAKEMATADHLSDGRVDFGIGVGWSWEEFEACGVPWERRGARTDEYLEVMRSLWTEHDSSFEGEFYSLPSCHLYPKPIQNPFPVHVGGHSRAAMRRTARFAQGWFGFAIGPEDTADCLVLLDEELAKEGRTRADVRITVCPPRKLDAAMVEAFRGLGVDELLTAYHRQQHDSLGAWFESVVPFVDQVENG
jgi:probable F420-dependent oxidoreductase